MAKRVRRPRRRRQTPDTTSGEETPAKSLSAQEEFEADYAYVLKDLRYIFILAAIMFALLIGLNIFLTG